MTKTCRICGKEFEAIANNQCCSAKCKKENRRGCGRRSYHNNKHKIDKYEAYLACRRKRIKKRIENES